jgi:uncharacterized protein with PQ loop repeat
MIDLELFGYIAGVLGVIAWVPQLRKVWVNKQHKAVSLPTLVLVIITLSMWVIYGVAIDASAVIWSNIAAVTIIACIIFGVIRLRKSQIITD